MSKSLDRDETNFIVTARPLDLDLDLDLVQDQESRSRSKSDVLDF